MVTRRGDRGPPLSRDGTAGGWGEVDIGYRNEDWLCSANSSRLRTHHCRELVAVASVGVEKTGRLDATTDPTDFILDRSLRSKREGAPAPIIAEFPSSLARPDFDAT